MKSLTSLIKIFHILIFLAPFALHARTEGVTCYPSITDKEFDNLVTETKISYFPQLLNLSISIKKFNSDAYYLQASPDYKSLVKKKASRKYFIEINTKLLNCPPSMESLEAILVHEFEHLNDYNKMSSVTIADLGIKYATNKKFRTRYERKTDEKALKKGIGHGLIGYRNWIYSRLTPKQLATKKRYYFTPEEIEEWMDHHE
ncbi:MAG: hypothetical protein K2P81_11695 [Bacteriovoracaceae bacterium]|nr:hypothetical protein [Bacteriovoracaceae bacterium]